MQEYNFKPITAPNLKGVLAEVAGKKVEVIEAYDGKWLVFCYEAGVMVRTSPNASLTPEYLSEKAAMKKARKFLGEGR